MVCKDVDVANQVAHRDNLDGVTMEGTQVSKKGVFKGGFYDATRCATKPGPLAWSTARLTTMYLLVSLPVAARQGLPYTHLSSS